MNLIQEKDFQKYLIESEPVVKMMPLGAWDQEIKELFQHGERLQGACLPWVKTHENIRFRGGDVTLWQGMTGHGKSQVLGQASVGFAAQGEKVCIASFEMQPTMTANRLLRQIGGVAQPSEEFIDEMLDWCDDRIWIYNHVGSVTPENVYAAIRYAAQDLKCKHFVVDNLMKCVRDEEDRTGQKMFVDKMTELAQGLDIHIHLVHHVRKGASEYVMPGIFDARGSGTIVDQVAQLLTVFRNREKEDKLIVNPEDPKFKDAPDCIISCGKHRHGSWQGVINLWFRPDCLFYAPDSRCRHYDIRNPNLYASD